MPGWIGQPARRGSGELYADRLVLHEECLGALTPLHLGPRTRSALHEQLVPVLTLFAGEGVAHHRALTRAFLERHPRLAAGEAVALVDLLRLTEPDLDGSASTKVLTPLGATSSSRVGSPGR